MKRRKAIGRIALTGAGAALAWGGYKWYDWTKTPDLQYLEQNMRQVGFAAFLPVGLRRVWHGSYTPGLAGTFDP